jgi:hypothetical protein
MYEWQLLESIPLGTDTYFDVTYFAHVTRPTLTCANDGDHEGQVGC